MICANIISQRVTTSPLPLVPISVYCRIIFLSLRYSCSWKYIVKKGLHSSSTYLVPNCRNMNPKASAAPAEQKRSPPRRACKECSACLAPPCKECSNCLNPKFKKKCKRKLCPYLGQPAPSSTSAAHLSARGPSTSTGHPAQKLTKKCAGHRSTPIYEQSSAPPLKAPRGLQGGPLQSESIHSSLDIFKGSGHQKSESVFREFILRLELLSANYITTHLKLLSYSFECL